MRMHGNIKGQKVRIMVDDCATHNFLNYSLVKKLKLPESPSAHKYVVSLAKGSDKKVWDTMIHGIEVDIQGYKENLDFQIMHLDRTDVILGREWLYGLGNTLQRSY